MDGMDGSGWLDEHPAVAYPFRISVSVEQKIDSAQSMRK